MTQRKCGTCTLCCRLLPVQEGVHIERADAGGLVEQAFALAELLPEFVKAAGEKCKHQCSKGCRIYENRPLSCRGFECMWLQGADVPRPDHAHYVIGPTPNHIKVNGRRVPCVEVWVDGEAWRDDKRLRALATHGAEKGYAMILRYDESEACILMPPWLSPTGEWVLTERAPANAKRGEV